MSFLLEHAPTYRVKTEQRLSWSVLALLAFFAVTLGGYFSGAGPVLFSLAPLVLAASALLAVAAFPWPAGLLLIAIAAVAVYLRLPLSDFALNVGDGSSYFWDGVRAVNGHADAGFFPPLSSSISSVGYFFFGLDAVPAFHMAVSVVSVLLFAGAVYVIFGNWIYAAIAAALFAVHPLNIWFAKTTYSETLWQPIILICLAAFASRERRKTLFILCAVAALSTLVRGSSLFLVFAILTALMSVRQERLFVRTLDAAIIVVLFGISFGLNLNIRSGYLIGWQFTRIWSGATPLGIWALVMASLSLFVVAAAICERLFGERARRYITLLGLVAVKVGAAAGFAAIGKGEFFKLLIGNETGWSIATFGLAGAIIALVGGVLTAWCAVVGREWAIFSVAIYAFASIPFALQNFGVEQWHEMYFYYGRYFHSELLVVYVLFWVVTLAGVASILSRSAFGKQAATAAFVVGAAGSVAWGEVRHLSGQAYLVGGVDVIKYLSSLEADGEIVIISDRSHLYNRYNAKHLLDGIPNLKPVRIVEIDEDDGFPQIERGRTVVCVSNDFCQSAGLRRVDERSFAVTWTAQTTKPDIRTASFAISVYRAD